MEDTSKLNMTDTCVLDDNTIERTEDRGMTVIPTDLDDEPLAETLVLDDDAIAQADGMGMTRILKDLDDHADDPDDEPTAAASGYTIELSLDDDD